MIHWNNLRYILRHKWFVFRECCRLGIPWLGIIHDWSKFLPDEWIAYARFFYANAPEDRIAQRQCPGYTGPTAESVREAFDVAWLRHQHRNRHHWQYWLLVNDTEAAQSIPIPDHYLREMAADWIGASAARGADVREWWNAHGSRVSMRERDYETFKRYLGV